MWWIGSLLTTDCINYSNQPKDAVEPNKAMHVGKAHGENVQIILDKKKMKCFICKKPHIFYVMGDLGDFQDKFEYMQLSSNTLTLEVNLPLPI